MSRVALLGKRLTALAITPAVERDLFKGLKDHVLQSISTYVLHVF